MTSLLLVGVVAIAMTIGVAVLVSRRMGSRPLGGLVLIAATPLGPHVSLIGPLSIDDILPLLGVVTLLLSLPRPTLADSGTIERIRIRMRQQPITALGAVAVALLAIAGLIASVGNAVSLADAVPMLLRGPGRVLFLALIAVLAVRVQPAATREWLVARAIAIVGAIEGFFGIVAFLLPLPDHLGLEATRKSSALYYQVPGRVNGTLGSSPDFFGAILLFTLPVTVALALGATERRERMWWWASAVAQMLALALSFTRSSLGLALVALTILLLVRNRIRYLVPLAAVVGVVALTTPLIARLLNDVPDRFALWSSAIRLMLDRPLIGTGPGRMLQVALTDPERYRATAFGTATSNAHNTILIAGAELGVLGAVGALLLNFALALLTLRILRHARDRSPTQTIRTALALGTLAVLVQGMVNNLFTVAVTGTMLALVVGAFLIEAPATEPSVPPGAEGHRARSRSVDRGAAVDGQPVG